MKKKFLTFGVVFSITFTTLFNPLFSPILNLTEVSAATVIEDKYFIPLRNVFESNAGSVNWNGETKQIEIFHSGNNYEFALNENSITKNGTTSELKYPIKNINGATYIHYDDVSFVYEQENDTFKNTKKELVTNAYYYMSAQGIPGMTAAFADNKTGYTWTQGFGMADIEKNIPSTKDTLYSVGSISKSFTALGILKLEEEGKLNINDKVTTHIPEFSLITNPIFGGNSSDVTIKQLLTHYSGINGDIFRNFYTLGDYEKSFLDGYVETLQKEYMTSVSGTRMSYANSGYAVLGNIISKTTGEQTNIFDGFNNYMNGNLIKSMGLNNTAFAATENDNFAKSYANTSLGKSEPVYVNNIPAGALFTNSVDMANFLQLILNKGVINDKRVFEEKTIEKFLKEIPFQDPLTDTISPRLGTYEVNYNNQSYIGHGGDVEYFHSDYRLALSAGIGIFISANSSSSISVPNILTVDTLANALSETERQADYVPAKDTSSYVYKDANEYGGYYVGLGDVIVTDANVIIPEQNFTFQKTDNKNEFAHEVIGAIVFATIGDVDVMLSEGMIVTQKAERIPADDDLKNMAGKYYQVKSEYEFPVFDSVIIKIDSGGYGFISIPETATIEESYVDIPISKVSDNKYIVLGIGRNLSNVIEVVEMNGEQYFKYNGCHYKKG